MQTGEGQGWLVINETVGFVLPGLCAGAADYKANELKPFGREKAEGYWKVLEEVVRCSVHAALSVLWVVAFSLNDNLGVSYVCSPSGQSCCHAPYGDDRCYCSESVEAYVDLKPQLSPPTIHQGFLTVEKEQLLIYFSLCNTDNSQSSFCTRYSLNLLPRRNLLVTC